MNISYIAEEKFGLLLKYGCHSSLGGLTEIYPAMKIFPELLNTSVFDCSPISCPCFGMKVLPCKRFYLPFSYLFNLPLQGQVSSGKCTRILFRDPSSPIYLKKR